MLILIAFLAIEGDTLAQTNPVAKASTWKLSASASLKEFYDSNVYLQSETALANQGALVTSFTPQVSGAWTPGSALSASLNYAPELAWYAGESLENNVTHRIALPVSGKLDAFSYDSVNTVVVIDGSSIGPTWTGQGGAPAAGGIPVRDRRDAAVYRSSLRFTLEVSKWFLRPAATFYLHDFQTLQSSAAGYQNYVDRSEVTGGFDFGKRAQSTSLWLAYRYGYQHQAQLLQFPEQYDNTFNRVLFGVEGAPLPWLKFNIIIGPEFRHYGDQVPASFGNHDVINVFADASVSLLPTKQDTVTLSVKQFQQPGFGGRSAYDDLTCDLTWRHKFNDRFTLGIGGRGYNTDFLYPVVRDDWILSGSAFLNWSITKQLNAECSYVYEAGLSMIPNTSGREYSRHLVAIGVKFNFQPLPVRRSGH